MSIFLLTVTLSLQLLTVMSHHKHENNQCQQIWIAIKIQSRLQKEKIVSVTNNEMITTASIFKISSISEVIRSGLNGGREYYGTCERTRFSQSENKIYIQFDNEKTSIPVYVVTNT